MRRLLRPNVLGAHVLRECLSRGRSQRHRIGEGVWRPDCVQMRENALYISAKAVMPANPGQSRMHPGQASQSAASTRRSQQQKWALRPA